MADDNIISDSLSLESYEIDDESFGEVNSNEVITVQYSRILCHSH